jgi:hypothetical protein
MRCGNCKKDHDTVAEVRKCYGVDSSGLTPEQQTYLHDLLKLFNLVLPGELTPETIDRRAGKAILDGLVGARRLRTMGHDYKLPDGVLVSPKPKPRRSGERRPATRRGK